MSIRTKHGVKKALIFVALAAIASCKKTAPTNTPVATGWDVVGSSRFSPGQANYPSIDIDNSGTPYVVFGDASRNTPTSGIGPATVMKFNGSNWVNVGNADFSPSGAQYTSLAINSSGTPYVAFEDFGSSQQISVMMYNGSSWVNVGNAGFSASAAPVTNTSITFDPSGTPYVLFAEQAYDNAITVMKFDGTNWVNVGRVGFTRGGAFRPTMAIDGSGIPYVAYVDVDNHYGASVMKYDGSNWVYVGPVGFTAGATDNTSIAIDANGTPYVFFQDLANSNKATVMKYNGSSWVNVGQAGFSAGQAWTYEHAIAIASNGTPYVVYEDYGNNFKTTVMMYNGSSWASVGSAGFSLGSAAYPSLALDDSGRPFVAYQDTSVNGHNISVMKYAQ